MQHELVFHIGLLVFLIGTNDVCNKIKRHARMEVDSARKNDT